MKKISSFHQFIHFWDKKIFLKKSGRHAKQAMSPKHHAECHKKIMNQSQENFWTEGRTDPNS